MDAPPPTPRTYRRVDSDTKPHIRIGPAQVGRVKGETSLVKRNDKGVITGHPGADAAPESRLERVVGGREVRRVREAGDEDFEVVDRDGAPGVVAGRPAQVRRVDRMRQRGVELDHEGVDPAR